MRGAIERLRLAPVMFELGARPHPPRDLYRAYLEQSDVFIGIYGERYGWIAPGEDISGLEDEYRLAPRAMPKLIYVQASKADRDERLVELIGRIRADDTASYKSYSSVDDLADLRRGRSGHAPRRAVRRVARRRPRHRPRSSRRRCLRPTRGSSAARASSRRCRACSTTTRRGWSPCSALEGSARVDWRSRSRRPRPQAFPMAQPSSRSRTCTEPALLIPSIAYGLGIRDTGEQSLEERLAVALDGRRMLIVLDNFEQLVEAAPTLVRLYSLAPTVDVPGDQPGRAAHPRRAGLRGAALRPRPDLPRLARRGRQTPPPCGCSSSARGPCGRTSS